VVAKAEAGGPLAVETIATLARALTTDSRPIAPDALTMGPLSVARAVVTSYREAGVETGPVCQHLLSRNVAVHVDGDFPGLSFPNGRNGIDAFHRLWRSFFTLLRRDGGDLGDPRRMMQDADRVVVWGRELIRVPEALHAPPWFVLFDLTVTDGLVSRFSLHFDSLGLALRLAAWAEQHPRAEWAPPYLENSASALLATSGLA
jgi:hypothetical protein